MRQRRLQMTVADAMAFAITPLLIMVLIASLSFFLIAVLYQGQFHGRLNFIFAMFIMATVCVGRISMEEGSERAFLYSIPLGLVALLALNQFVVLSPGVAAFSLPVNIALLAIIWWCAHKLTWDCTLDDESVLASGEGLLEKVGLDGAGALLEGERQQPSLETVREHTAEDERLERQAARSWMSAMMERQPKKHTPGLWVVYFSFGALPIFGLGQLFLPDSVRVREYVFRLLVLYVLSALALLLTTSFLGLRKYLRQRSVAMPNSIAGAWLGFGTSLIVVLLFFCSWLPRPGGGVFSQLPFYFKSPDGLSSSDYGLGNEGIQEEDGSPRSSGDDGSDSNGTTNRQTERKSNHGNNPNKNSNNKQAGQGGAEGGESKSNSSASDNSRKNSKSQQQKAGERGSRNGMKGRPGERSQQRKSQQKKGTQSSRQTERQDGKTQSKAKQNPSNGNDGGKTSGQKSRGNNKSGNNGNERTEQANKSQSRNKSQSNNKRQSNNKSQSSNKSQNGESQNGQRTKRRKSQSTRERRSDQRDSSTKSSSKSQSSQKGSWKFSPSFGGLVAIIKLIFQGLVILVVIYLIVKNWDALVKAWKELWADIFGWWNGKRPDQPTSSEEAVETVTCPDRAFAEFSNPFHGNANSDPAELVRYCYAAFEAWARERGITRLPDQTVYEFAVVVGSQLDGFGNHAKLLAQLYSQAAFAEGSLTPRAIPHLKEVWAAMENQPALVTTD